MLASAAAEHGSSIGVVDRDTTTSWSELHDAVDDVAGRLTRLGVGPGSVAALLLPNSVTFVVAFFAAARCGAVVLPLNSGFRPGEVVAHLRQAGASHVLVDVGRDVAELDDGVQVCQLDGLRLVSPAVGRDVCGTVATSDADALLQFSSGSTGASKQVVRTNAALVAEADALHRTAATQPDDVILCVVPLFHAHGLGNGLLAAVRAGARLVVLDGFARNATVELLRREQVTLFPAVPLVFETLAASRRLDGSVASSVRLAFSAGAPLSRAAAEGFAARTRVGVRQLYGCTEAGAVTLNVAGAFPETAESVGPPLHGNVVKVLDDEGKPVAAGHEGEVAISGPSLFRGYRTPTGVDRTAFRDELYLTGDVGRIEGDALWLGGRRTVFVNVAGNKVDPAEVERVIAAVPGVVEVVVVGVPGPGGERVKAAVVAGGVDRSTVLEACRASLAEYKVPRIVEFVDEIPRNPMGKVLRKYLVDT